MKVLEISPLEGKLLRVIVVEKEYNEPFWIIEPPHTDVSRGSFLNVSRPSIAFCKFLENLIEEAKPDFATEELGNRSIREFTENNEIAQIFKRKNVPFFAVDIDEYAREGLTSLIEEKIRLRDRMIEALKDISQEEDEIKREYLTAYIQCLQEEIEEAEREIKFSIRERWIAMGILENARRIEKVEITCLHISSPEHVNGVRSILESVGVEVETIKPVKKLLIGKKEAASKGLEELLESAQIQVKPLIRKSSEELPYILFYLDPDEKASPFDICMAYDAGFNVVIPYENVTARDAKKIVQDAIFSRDPRGIKRICFFIGGKDMEKTEEILKVVRDTMFPPFEANIIVDPAGAYTTAAAMVAKVEEALARSSLGDLKGKRCAIFGTGAVGKTAAILLAKMGCDVTIVSPNPQRADGEEYAASLSSLLRTKYGIEVRGVFAPTQDRRIEVVKGADVIFCAAGAGIQLISKDMLSAVRLAKVIADVNAVPPFGIEGIKLNDDMREIVPGVFTIGALTIGRLKYKLEQEILRGARRSEKTTTYDYNYAFQLARRILKEEPMLTKLTVTLKYPPKERGLS